MDKYDHLFKIQAVFKTLFLFSVQLSTRYIQAEI